MTDTPLNFSPEILAFIILALIASVLLGWLLGDRKSATYRVDLKRLNEESERTQAELILLKSNAHNKQYDIEKATADIQSQLLDIARLTEREEQTKVRERELQEQLKRAEANLGELRGKEQHLNATLATEQEARQQEQRNAEEKLIVLNDAREQLLKEFENLSQKIFEKKTAQFAEQSQQGINTLLSPFREQLDGLKKKVEEVYVSDVRDRAT